MTVEFRGAIKGALEKLGFSYHENDLDKLFLKMRRLQDFGSNLEKINNRLLEQKERSNFLATLTEICFTADITMFPSIKISYEDSTIAGSIDLEVNLGSNIYLIQIKRCSKQERINKMDNLMEQLKRLANREKVSICKFFYVKLSEGFEKKDVKDLFESIKLKAIHPDCKDDTDYPILIAGKKALICFYRPESPNTKLDCLTLSFYDDLCDGGYEDSGEKKKQIRESLIKACNAFDSDTNNKYFKLITIEIEDCNVIDLCDVVFGSEIFNLQSRHLWTRQNDGLFVVNGNFTSKVFGVIAMIKEDKYSLVSDYRYALLVNPNFKEQNLSISNMFNEVICNDTFVGLRRASNSTL